MRNLEVMIKTEKIENRTPAGYEPHLHIKAKWLKIFSTL